MIFACITDFNEGIHELKHRCRGGGFKSLLMPSAPERGIVAGACADGAGRSVGDVQPEYRQIVVATGSPFELGLIDAIADDFQARHGGIVRCIKTPTGPGLDLGRHGMAHITMGHDKDATTRFEEEGNVAKRADLMHNYTIVVGPPDDPANIDGLEDEREAHRRIFNSGAACLSRGDGGGMHMLEMDIWKSLDLNPEGKHWYEVSNRFMLESLLQADRNGQYHMLDSSTWAMHKSAARNLRLLVKGQPNRYEICLVSAERHANLGYNRDLAEKFFAYMTGPEGRKIIAGFGVNEFGEPLYYPAEQGASE
ncbi:MAG TPA: substrate-binding domain-containing protein [Acidobacteriota bacterium]|nr:substrate-binding domain-containing protein [Acidobacteriota bacterium]